MAEEPTKIKRLVLELDEADYEHVMGAMKRRARLGNPHAAEGRPTWEDADDPILPDGEGNIEGRLIAEICRGWAEKITGWDWASGEPMDPDIAGSIRHEDETEDGKPA